MLFNSIEFAVFLFVLFFLYWFAANRNLALQNCLLLVSGYFFYAWWDWRFLFLLILLSLSNFALGIGIEKSQPGNAKKLWFLIGLIINIGVLAVFKYFNFFITGFIDLFSSFGYVLPSSTIKIILPLGISFYVFLSLSYIIDIYRGNMIAGKNVIEVLLTLGFFPILLAGPIQRPSLLLPQITKKREFDYGQAVDGLKQILWGLFAKIAVADQIAKYADDIFKNYSGYSGSTLVLGAFFFAVQIYADFSGYSNIAIGTAKLLGFSLMQNFAFPYFSRDIKEFWQRWHISLTTWFRDYVFMPLSFSIASRIKNDKILFIKTNQFIYIAASILTWFLTGLWHGASFTFITWGLVNGVLLIIYHLQLKPRKNIFKKLNFSNNNSVLVICETLFTFTLINLAWVFFKSGTVNDAFLYLKGIFSLSLFTVPEVRPKIVVILIIVFFIVELIGRKRLYAIAGFPVKLGRPFRWAFYYAITLAVLWFSGNQQGFIYFQF